MEVLDAACLRIDVLHGSAARGSTFNMTLLLL
jgi:hypothetical protein